MTEEENYFLDALDIALDDDMKRDIDRNMTIEELEKARNLNSDKKK